MTTFWIIFTCFLILMVFLEPFGQLVIKRKEEYKITPQNSNDLWIKLNLLFNT